jgi:hypothetical protein
MSRRHMLPYGTRDRPIYPGALQRSRCKPRRHAAWSPIDVPSKGLWPKLASGYSAASVVTGAKRSGSYTVPSRNTYWATRMDGLSDGAGDHVSSLQETRVDRADEAVSCNPCEYGAPGPSSPGDSSSPHSWGHDGDTAGPIHVPSTSLDVRELLFTTAPPGHHQRRRAIPQPPRGTATKRPSMLTIRSCTRGLHSKSARRTERGSDEGTPSVERVSLQLRARKRGRGTRPTGATVCIRAELGGARSGSRRWREVAQKEAIALERAREQLGEDAP